MDIKKCPNCGVPWERKENIYEFFRHNRGYSKKDAAEAADMYGCTKEHPKHFGINVVGIETEQYDGVSYWKCEKCGIVFDRWTMKKTTIKD